METLKLPRMQDLYKGRTVFVTGASGFLGKRVLFNRIRRECPERLSKLVPVQGDIGLPDLGLSHSDLETILAETSMVFHLAATVRFNASLKEAVELNVEGAARVISLCHRMPKLESYLHCSTTYVNSDRRWTIVEEKLYPAPCDPHLLIEAKNSMELSLFESIGKGATEKYGNTYCFTKCVAEHLVMKEAADLPAIIFRPAVVLGIWRDGIPGWSDAFQGSAALTALFCTGALARIPVDVNSHCDGVPVDMASAAILTCAAYRASMSEKCIPIVHCNSSTLNPIAHKTFLSSAVELVFEYPFETMLATPVLSHLGSDPVERSMHHLREKYVGPALDKVLVFAGQKPFFGRLYERVNEAYVMFYRFVSGHIFKTDNLMQLLDMMTEEDKETFDFDIRKLDWLPFGIDCFFGCKAFLMKEDIGNPESLRKAKRNIVLHRIKDFVSWLIVCYILTALFSGSWSICLLLTLILFFSFSTFVWEKRGVPSMLDYVKRVEDAMGEPLNPKSSMMKISRNRPCDA